MVNVAWDNVTGPTDNIAYTEWNNMRDYIKSVIATSGNVDTANITINGAELKSFTAGETIVPGDLCYFKSDGQMWKADASAEATAAGLLAISTESKTAGQACVFAMKGTISGLSSLTVGATEYMSLTAGGITETKPSATGEIVRVVGYALTTTSMYFNPDNTYIEVL